MLVRLPYFYKMYGLNKVVMMPFKKQKPFLLKQVAKMQQEDWRTSKLSKHH